MNGIAAGRRLRIVGFIALVIAVLGLTPSAAGDAGLILRKAVVRPGERMTVWGGCRVPIYLVTHEVARRQWFYFFSVPSRRPPKTKPFRFLGRTTCTGRHHYVGDYPDGDFASWSGYLHFRVPRVRPGRYELVLWCSECRPGPPGSLIVNNWLWRGDTRLRRTSLFVQA
jgi:hypothetical protein